MSSINKELFEWDQEHGSGMKEISDSLDVCETEEEFEAILRDLSTNELEELFNFKQQEMANSIVGQKMSMSVSLNEHKQVGVSVELGDGKLSTYTMMASAIRAMSQVGEESIEKVLEELAKHVHKHAD